MGREAYIAQLQAIGHYRSALVHTLKDRWYVECECGYRSSHRLTHHDAVGGLLHHRSLELAKARRNGVSLPSVALKVR